MKKFLSILPRWLPALSMMIAIFLFSSLPGKNMPVVVNLDYVIKKTGHVIGYGMLSLSYFHFFKRDPKRAWLAWLLAVLYAATDEFHQSFVPGRHASILDVLVFDNFGAALALYFYRRKYEKENQSA